MPVGSSTVPGDTLTTPLLIGGDERDAAEAFAVRDPSSGEVVGRAAAASGSDARDAVGAAHGAWPAWAALPASERRTRVLAALDDLSAEDGRGELLVRENGKVRFEADIELHVFAARFLQA